MPLEPRLFTLPAKEPLGQGRAWKGGRGRSPPPVPPPNPRPRADTRQRAWPGLHLPLLLCLPELVDHEGDAVRQPHGRDAARGERPDSVAAGLLAPRWGAHRATRPPDRASPEPGSGLPEDPGNVRLAEAAAAGGGDRPARQPVTPPEAALSKTLPFCSGPPPPNPPGPATSLISCLQLSTL